MKCPACGSALEQMLAGSIELDACINGCGGVWFDQNEVLKFDEQHEFSTHPILNLAKDKASTKVDHSKQKQCPKCANEPLVRQFFDIKHEVEIDQCWSCSGIWLDVGELNQLRAQYATMEERSEAVNQYVETELATHQAKMQAETEVAVSNYNEQCSNRFKGAIYAFKRLLGIDDTPTDGL